MNIPNTFFSTYSKFDLLSAMDRAERDNDIELLQQLEDYARWRKINYKKIEIQQ